MSGLQPSTMGADAPPVTAEQAAPGGRLNLAFACYKYFPYGGMQRDAVAIARACLARGHRVTLHVMEVEGALPEGLPVRCLGGGRGANFRRYERFAHRLRQQASWQQADLRLALNKIPGCDLYFAADGCFVERYARRSPWHRLTPRYRHFARAERALFGGQGAQILALSPAAMAAYQQVYDTPGDRFHLLPPGVAADRRAPAGGWPAGSGDALRRDLAVEQGTLLLLQVGSGFQMKGVDRSLRAVAALPGELRNRVCYLVIGQDKPGRYLRLARRLGIAAQFRLLPGRDDIPRFLQAADLLLHPARHENTGGVLVEALAAGLPVITTASCGYAHHVQAAGAGLVVPEPFVQARLNQLLQTGLTDAARRGQWRERALAYASVEDLYTLHAQAVRVIEALARGAGAGTVGEVHHGP